MKMKTLTTNIKVIALVASAAFWLMPSATFAQDDGGDLTPKRFGLDRYKKIWADRSPFEIIIDEPPVVDEGPPPFEDYSLTGYYKRGNVWHVTLVNMKDPKEKHHIATGKKAGPGEFELVSFKAERNYKNSMATVSMNGKTDTVGFNEKRLKPGTGIKGALTGGNKPPSSNPRSNTNRSQPPNTNRNPSNRSQPNNASRNPSNRTQFTSNNNNQNRSNPTGAGTSASSSSDNSKQDAGGSDPGYASTAGQQWLTFVLILLIFFQASAAPARHPSPIQVTGKAPGIRFPPRANFKHDTTESLHEHSNQTGCLVFGNGSCVANLGSSPFECPGRRRRFRKDYLSRI